MSRHMPFAQALLEWYGQHGRDLPWRHTRDPYAIWLSEVVLQQTRIDQGHGYWLRLMQEFPTVRHLAAATQDQVLRQWQGLGYYSRARNLHAAARQIVEMGGFPSTAAGLKQLKGVGDYTAAAVASLAFGEDVAVVDGNVYRVLARHQGIATPINSTQGKREFAALAQALLPAGHAAAYNQAIMDFGALQCTPKNPQCHTCPLADSCQALASHTVQQLPVKLKTVKVSTRHLTLALVEHGGKIALRRRPAGDIWQGLWEPLVLEGEGARLPQWGTATLLKRGVKHVLTHRILLADFYHLACDKRPTLPQDYIWVTPAQIDDYGVPRLVQLLLECWARFR